MWHARERREICARLFMRNPEGNRPLGRTRRNDRMGSECVLGKLAAGVERIQLVQDRGRWRAVPNAVMNLRVLAPRN
jgi:hypothetical protein